MNPSISLKLSPRYLCCLQNLTGVTCTKAVERPTSRSPPQMGEGGRSFYPSGHCLSAHELFPFPQPIRPFGFEYKRSSAILYASTCADILYMTAITTTPPLLSNLSRERGRHGIFRHQTAGPPAIPGLSNTTQGWGTSREASAEPLQHSSRDSVGWSASQPSDGGRLISAETNAKAAAASVVNQGQRAKGRTQDRRKHEPQTVSVPRF